MRALRVPHFSFVLLSALFCSFGELLLSVRAAVGFVVVVFVLYTGVEMELKWFCESFGLCVFGVCFWVDAG